MKEGYKSGDLVYVSQNGDNKLCLICHEDIWRNGGGVQELRCMQRFHKEVKHVCFFLSLSFSEHVMVHDSFLKIFY